MLEKGTANAEVIGPQENLAPIFAWVLASAMYAHLENGLNESAPPPSPPADSDRPGSPADVPTHPESSIVQLKKASPCESGLIDNGIEVVRLKTVDVISSSSGSDSARGSTTGSGARVNDVSSADTTGDLRKNLQLMAEQCQMLASQLKTVEQKQSTVHRTNSNPCAEETAIVSPCCAELRRKLKAVTEENIRLRAVLKDVTGVNKRWQKYNKERQQHIENLLETIKELKARVSSLEEAVQKANVEPKISNIVSANVPNNAENVIVHRHSDSSLLDQSSSLRQSYENAVKENCSLQKIVEEQSQNINSLTQQIESIRSEKDECIQVLTVQLKSHKEDWEAERREKQQAIERLAGVLEELAVLRKKCREQEQHNARRNGRILNGCGTEAYLQFTNGYCPQESPDPSAPELSVEIPSGYRTTTTTFNIPARHIRVTERGLGGRRDRNDYYEFNAVVTDGASNEPCENGAVVNDKSTDKCNGLPALTANDSNTVECPGCHVAFPSDRHVNFLDHFEACQAGQGVCSANT